MPKQKMTQEDKEEKAFDDLIKTMQIMYHQALKNSIVTGRLKAANGFLTLMVEDLLKREESK